METSRRIDNVHYSVYPNSFAKKMTSFDVYEALTTQASLGVKKLQDLPVKERLAIGLAESWKWFQWRLQENIRTATQSEDIRQELSNSFEKLRDIASGDSELGIAAAASSNLGMDDVEYEWGNIYREMSSEEDIYNDDKIDEQFMQSFSLMIQRVMSQGPQDMAQVMMSLQEALLEHSTYGRDIVARQERQQQLLMPSEHM